MVKQKKFKKKNSINSKNKSTKSKKVKKKELKKSNLSKKKPTIKKKKKLTKLKNKKNLSLKNFSNNKKSKNLSNKKSKKSKQVEKKLTQVKVKDKSIKKNKLKKEINFDNYIQGIVSKLIEKNKVDGIYTIKIIEKAVPKKFRIQENINKVVDIIKSSNITIISEEEALELIKSAKDDQKKSDEDGDDEKKQSGKTDDPVRLYLRDMGAVELLSREGEIAIAKRIEAGREKMIGAICESPMTIRSIINWKDSIKDGTMLLRDIVDLEATYDMSDIGESKLDDTLKLIEGNSKKKEKDKKTDSKDKVNEEEDKDPSSEDEEDDEEGLNVSLAAMEEKLKPKVLKDFDDITKLFKKLQKHSLELMNGDKKNQSSYASLEKKYKKVQK